MSWCFLAISSLALSSLAYVCRGSCTLGWTKALKGLVLMAQISVMAKCLNLEHSMDTTKTESAWNRQQDCILPAVSYPALSRSTRAIQKHSKVQILCRQVVLPLAALPRVYERPVCVKLHLRCINDVYQGRVGQGPLLHRSARYVSLLINSLAGTDTLRPRFLLQYICQYICHSLDMEQGIARQTS
jgi:hypothetical protein